MHTLAVPHCQEIGHKTYMPGNWKLVYLCGHVCMYVYVCTCVYMYVYVYVYLGCAALPGNWPVYLCGHVCIYVCTCVYMYVYECVCVCTPWQWHTARKLADKYMCVYVF